ncbi:MAG: methyltransferase domain-containing protein [Methanomicrobiales archaeon]|nr:methyltransferase domain-containing protein [Methanomicrobiales archaeon]
MHRIYPVQRARWLLSPLRKVIQSPDRLLCPYLQEGDTVIDLGCGPGFFTLPMARMVGETGRVIAVDVQEEMLVMLEMVAREKGLHPRVHLHLCRNDSPDLADGEIASFALAFHVLHETSDVAAVLHDLHGALKPGGRLLIAEPILVVKRKEFAETIGAAERAGFRSLPSPFVLMSRTALMERGRTTRASC